MLTIKAMTGGANYGSVYLSKSDYYSKSEQIQGQWMGRGAQLLGLEGTVTMEAFDAIRLGNDPKTGEFLRPRHSADRHTEKEINGELVTVTAMARNLYDFTLSAPKDISIQALEDPRLIEAHNAGVRAGALEMEKLAGAYVRRDNAQSTRPTSNLVISAWQHDTSRDVDPQLHTHLVAGNMTYDGAEGRWKALAPYAIYQQAEYITEVYRNAAAAKVLELGYDIEPRYQDGKYLGFGIVGIEQSTRDKFSQRSAQRNREIEKFIDENGRQPSTKEIARLVRDSRPENRISVDGDPADVQDSLRARRTPAEAKTAKDLREKAELSGSKRHIQPAEQSFTYAAEHMFERVSVARDYELKIEALRHGTGRIEIDDLNASLLKGVARGEMLTARGDVATQETLARELRMVATVNQGIGQYQPLGRPGFVVSDRLRAEQKIAVTAILESRDLAFDLQGAAGVGKTVALDDLRRGLAEARRSVMAVGPSASSVDVLRKEGFPEAMTIARLLADPQQQHQLRGQVLIIDEAGMVGSKDMAQLLDLAKSKDARILFSGDTKQIKSVEQGDALRVLEERSNLKSVSLRQVQRQLNAEYKAAVEALRTNPPEGYKKLEAMGAIREVDWRMRAREVSQAYREASVVLNVKGKERSVLVVAATHDEIKSVTHAIRTDRKRAGELLEGERLTRHTPFNWTEAQKKQTKNYQPGQVLEFHKRVKGIAKNEALEVVSADKSGITARKANGRTVPISGKQAQAFGVFEKQEIEVSAGDKLLLQANWKDKGFKATNGELVTVAAVEDYRIRLEDGRQLPAGYRQFTHGYAVTANYSQGKTVDHVIVLNEGMALDKFYTAATRAREAIAVFTSDKMALQEALGVSGERPSAIELAERAGSIHPAPSLAADHELFQVYQAQHQARQQQQSQQVVQQIQEITTHDIHRSQNTYGISL